MKLYDRISACDQKQGQMGEKMWTKWGLNPRPHATELLSQELAKQARYHCAIRPLHNGVLQDYESAFKARKKRRKIRASPPPRLQVWGGIKASWLLIVELCRHRACHYSR